jgi:hypothetical protein
MISTSAWVHFARESGLAHSEEWAATSFVALQYNCCSAIRQALLTSCQHFFSRENELSGFGLGKMANSPKFSG